MISPETLAQISVDWPSIDQLVRVLFLHDYNTQVVVLGVSALGLSAGVVGAFMLLRRQALLTDAVSHATLPGIGLAFMLMVAMGGGGRSLPGLLLGAGVWGVAAILCVTGLTRYTRLKDDVVLAVVLSVFFGLGVAVLGLIQNMQTGNAAGLSRFIYGKAASMLASESQTILIAGLTMVMLCALLFKEFTLVCFDQGYAATQGWPIGWLDLILMVMVVGVTVVGLQSVGLILVVAILIIPPAAARFWTDRLLSMAILSGLIGAASGYLGATLSGLIQNLPTGPIIVLTASFIFAMSLLLGVRRGVLIRVWGHIRLTQRIGMQNLLRASYELSEAGDGPVSFERLLTKRSWSPGHLQRLIRRARRHGLIEMPDAHALRLTPQGQGQAMTVLRNHRLWEMYLLTHADIAPSHVDRDADAIEHVLGADLIQRLEQAMAIASDVTPPSPHQLKGVSS